MCRINHGKIFVLIIAESIETRCQTIRRLLAELWRILLRPGGPVNTKPKTKIRVGLTVSVQAKEIKMTLKITTAQKINIQAAFENAQGTVVPVVGKPVWTSSDENIVQV